jgi:hypothetical protein
VTLGTNLHIVRGVLDHDATIDFYIALGYTVLDSGDTPTKFTLLSDGYIKLLINQDQMVYTGLIYFDDDHTQRVTELESAGFSFSRESNSAMFEILSGRLAANLVNTSYKDYDLPAKEQSPLGFFGEFSIPTKDYDADAAILEKVGFVSTGKHTEPYNWGILIDGLIPVGLHTTDDFSDIVLTYFSPRAKEIHQELEAKGMSVEKSTVTAPDGQRFFIFGVGDTEIGMMQAMYDKYMNEG